MKMVDNANKLVPSASIKSMGDLATTKWDSLF
jgi:hypothetical protein